MIELNYFSYVCSLIYRPFYIYNQFHQNLKEPIFLFKSIIGTFILLKWKFKFIHHQGLARQDSILAKLKIEHNWKHRWTSFAPLHHWIVLCRHLQSSWFLSSTHECVGMTLCFWIFNLCQPSTKRKNKIGIPLQFSRISYLLCSIIWQFKIKVSYT